MDSSYRLRNTLASMKPHSSSRPTAPTGKEKRFLPEHKEERNRYDECRVVSTALKKQLVSAFDNLYLLKPKNAYTGYSTKTALDIIQNLYSQYARIYAMDVSANDERLRYPYNVESPLKGII